jgi:murein L,D-transpeptidase YafK
MTRWLYLFLLVSAVALSTATQAAVHKKTAPKGKPKKAIPVTPVDSGLAEARLIEVYQLVAKSQSREALTRAESLVRDYPNFQLAQLIYGDLLSTRVREVKALGDVQELGSKTAATVLGELREESQKRLKALRERPPTGAIPSQFLSLAPRTRHAIAIDASRSRLYLFENQAGGLNLVADYYVSIGKLGFEKMAEGDLRTPLGIYFITGSMNPRALKEFYGSGALPINYPNELDNRRGKTGGGIWLHGTPPNQFARAPLATDGCVVLANPDLNSIIRTVQVRNTPVVIARSLRWVKPTQARQESKPFEATLSAWQGAKSRANAAQMLSFYSPEFNSHGKTLPQWSQAVRRQLDKSRGHPVQFKDLSMLRWTDNTDTMVVTFSELTGSPQTGTHKRQYWERRGNQWKIFYEGVIG